MKLSKTKMLLLMLSLILILISIFQISQTYSVFYSKLQGTSKIQIGQWDILVNNTLISNNYETNFIMNSLNFSTNNKVLNGKIAPGMYATGIISIKPSNVDVSIRYDIFVDRNVIDNEQIVIADLIVKDKEKDLVLTDENTFTGLILLDELEEGYEDIIELRIDWYNDEDNDKEDTNLGKNPLTDIKIPISIRFSQYLGETINEI